MSPEAQTNILAVIFVATLTAIGLAMLHVSMWFMVGMAPAILLFWWCLWEIDNMCTQRGRILGFSRPHLFEYKRGSKTISPNGFTEGEGSDTARCTVCDLTLTGQAYFVWWYD